MPMMQPGRWLPWAFPFYGHSYTSVYVSSNGFLDFTSTSSDPGHGDYLLENRVRIAPFWADLTTYASNGDDIYVTSNANYVAVRWQAHTWSTNFPANFEAVLYPNGNVEFNYDLIQYGLYSTVGISAGDGVHYTLSRYDNNFSIPPGVTTLMTAPLALPPGMSLSPAGVLSGTPTAAGQYDLAVTVTDSAAPQNSITTLLQLNVSSLPLVAITLPSDVMEGVGVASGAISISTALPTDLTVNLTSSDTSKLTVPTSVTIPAGQLSAPLPLTVLDDGLLETPEAVTISAAASGYANSADTITVHQSATATLTVSLPPSANELGVAMTGTITSSVAPTTDLTLQLVSSDPTQISVPATIILPAGQTSVSFTAALLDNHIIEAGATSPVTVTASGENLTAGAATVNVIDDDRTMTLTLPASGWEGQTLTGQGAVQIGGALTTDLVVSLASSDTTQLSVPATVTIPAGQTSAYFDVTLLDNGLRTGPQTETVTATAASLPTANSNMMVDDADLDHFVITTYSNQQTAGVPFMVTAVACDAQGNLIQVYNGTATLGAAGSNGALPISLTTVTFVNGFWYGNVAVDAVNPSIMFRMTDPTSGAVGGSSLFSTQPGPVAGFRATTIASTEYQDAAFPMTLTAVDANGYTVTNFSGTVNLSGMAAPTTSDSILGQPSVSNYNNNGTWTLGYSFTPSSNLWVSNVLHCFGDKVSIWTAGGQLVASQTFALSRPGWVATPLAQPVQLQAGVTYVIAAYSDGQNYGFWPNRSYTSSLGTMGQDYYAAGDNFPTISEGDDWWAVDIEAQAGDSTPVPTSLTSATFVGGVWTGNVTVPQTESGMYMQVDDGAGTCRQQAISSTWSRYLCRRRCPPTPPRATVRSTARSLFRRH